MPPFLGAFRPVSQLQCTIEFDARAAHVRASLPAAIVREGKVLYDARTVAA